MEQEKILGSILNQSTVPLTEVDRAIKHLKWSHKPQNLGSVINYNYEANRLAYLFLFVSAHSCAVETSFSYFLSSRQRNWLPDYPVSILSMGGGPGSEQIGLIKALKRKYPEIQQVRCTNVDKNGGWIRNYKMLLRHFAVNLDSTLNLALDFKQRDLSHPIPVSFWNPIKNQDIVTMVKFLSSFPKDLEIKRQIINNICAFMKPGSLLFYLDGQGDRESYNLLCVIASSHGLIPAYSNSLKFNTNLPDINQRIFARAPPNQLKMRVRIWLKNVRSDAFETQSRVAPIILTPSDLEASDHMLYNVQYCTYKSDEDEREDDSDLEPECCSCSIM